MIDQQMHDFEKGRIEYVQRLETQIESLSRAIAQLQANAKWTPIVGVNMQGDNVEITLEYCGKRKTIPVPTSYFQTASRTDLVTAITQGFLGDLVFDNLREAFETPITNVMNRAQASANMSTSTLAKG